MGRFLGAFWATYAAEAGLDAGFRVRAVRWAGVALLYIVYGRTHFEARYDERTRHLVGCALGMLGEQEAWAAILLGEDGGPPAAEEGA